ncbi:transglycosylase SLT domain-containing protein [bacterium]|nr:transglycosylase SLT domain-containing protein [bacterium]
MYCKTIIFYLLFFHVLCFAQTHEQIKTIDSLSEQRRSNKEWTSVCKHAIHTVDEVKLLLNLNKDDIVQTLQQRDAVFFDADTQYLVNADVIRIIGYYLIKHHNHQLKNFITYQNLYLPALSTYFPVFKKHFADYGIPKALLVLPIAETDLKRNLISGENAAGLWQFTEATAEEYGILYRDIDLRTDIDASTDAACRYLSNMYDNYNYWPLAVLGYNGGHNRIQRALDEHFLSPLNIPTQWQSFFVSLPQETQCHLNRLIALNFVFSYFDKMPEFRN